MDKAPYQSTLAVHEEKVFVQWLKLRTTTFFFLQTELERMTRYSDLSIDIFLKIKK